MLFNLQGNGVLGETAAAQVGVETEAESNVLWKKKEGVEPRSVLEHKRNARPTSTSTLSSSLGAGGGGSTDTSSVDGGVGGRRDEWASELQPIPLEIGFMGGEKCGLGVEDWETMLSETPAMGAAASPGQDQSFMRWIMGDVEDPSSLGSKQQQHQMLSQGPVSVSEEFDTDGGGGFGLMDPAFGFESLGGIGGGGGGVTPMIAASSSAVSGAGGFPIMNSSDTTSNNGCGNRIPTISTSSPLSNIRNPFFGSSPNPIFPPPQISAVNSFSQPRTMLFQEPMEEKPSLFSTNHLLNLHQSQNQSFFLPLNLYAQHEQQQVLPPQPKHLQSMADLSCQISPKVPFSNPVQDLFLRRHRPQQLPPQLQQYQNFGLHHNAQQSMKPKLAGDESSAIAAAQQHQALLDQLLKAAELVEAGNSVNAHGILARLNHQLSPHGKPLVRCAFYFKEALNAIVVNNPNMPPSSSPPPLQLKPPATPLDVVLKLNAYKNFSEISPVVQFTNFTCTQVLLEELSGCDHIHIVDFDIRVGGQWSSFMQEISQRRCSTSATSPSLKLTAFVTPSMHHNLELVLTRENLTHFASGLSIPFEFNILGLDTFDPVAIHNMSSSCNEVIAVNIPVGFSLTSSPTILHLVRQLSPKIMVSVDNECDRSDLSFSQHFLNGLHSYTALLESVAAGTNLEVANKIEQYLLQPRIESIILSRYHAASKMLPWRTQFTSAGFIPLPFSNFTETQAECLLKRTQVRGFHIEKRQSSLLLFWQRGELVSVSAWKC